MAKNDFYIFFLRKERIRKSFFFSTIHATKKRVLVFFCLITKETFFLFISFPHIPSFDPLYVKKKKMKKDKFLKAVRQHNTQYKRKKQATISQIEHTNSTFNPIHNL